MSSKSMISTLEDVPAKVLAVEAPAVLVGAADADGLSGRKVQVTFYEQEGDLGKHAIFAGLNGVGYNIPRGVRVDLPIEVLAVFNDAVMKSIETLQDGSQRERDVMRFAFQVHGEIPASAV